MIATVFLGLGANLGDRLASLRAAVRHLAPAVAVDTVSPVYETLPMYVADQPRFLNLVVRGRTALPPMRLLEAVKDLERRIGRSPSVRFGPRVIDIDILFYEDRILHLPGLEIPHPRLAERPFVLRPLADIAPDHVHPVSGLTAAALAAAVPGAADLSRVPDLMQPPGT